MLRAIQRTAVAAVLTTAVASGGQAIAARQPREISCGALARTRVVSILATNVGCREARTVARAHAASVRRNGACKTKRIGCDIARFRCLYAFKPQDPDRVLCSSRGDRKLVIAYRRR